MKLESESEVHFTADAVRKSVIDLPCVFVWFFNVITDSFGNTTAVMKAKERTCDRSISFSKQI